MLRLVVESLYSKRLLKISFLSTDQENILLLRWWVYFGVHLCDKFIGTDLVCYVCLCLLIVFYTNTSLSWNGIVAYHFDLMMLSLLLYSMYWIDGLQDDDDNFFFSTQSIAINCYKYTYNTHKHIYIHTHRNTIIIVDFSIAHWQPTHIHTDNLLSFVANIENNFNYTNTTKEMWTVIKEDPCYRSNSKDIRTDRHCTNNIHWDDGIGHEGGNSRKRCSCSAMDAEHQTNSVFLLRGLLWHPKWKRICWTHSEMTWFIYAVVV